MTGLEAAQRELAENPPPPLTLAQHPKSLTGLGELLGQREQGEVAEPAA